MNAKDSDQKRTDQRTKVLEEHKNVTSKISDSCRFIGFGLLAIFYTSKTGGGAFAEGVFKDHPCLVWTVGLAGFFGILVDYLQYFFASMAVDQALESDDFLYEKKSLPYWVWEKFFLWKQLIIFVGVVALGWLVVLS